LAAVFICDTLKLFTLDKFIADPLKALIMSCHIADQLFLELSVEPGHVLIEPLVASTRFNHGISSLEVAVIPVGSDQIQVVFNVHDWDGDMLVVNAHSNVLIQIILSPGLEKDWGILEEQVHLLLYFPLVDIVVFDAASIDVVLGGALLILDLKHLLLHNRLFFGLFISLVHFQAVSLL
jgi:hypothetical protein